MSGPDNNYLRPILDRLTELKMDELNTRLYVQSVEVENNDLKDEVKRLKKVCRDQAGVELSEENDRLIKENEGLKTALQLYVSELTEENSRLKAERNELLERCVATRKIYGIEIRDKFGLVEAAMEAK
jgi:uncharacterized membrane protein YheB (UPF0754 family)